MARSVIVDNHFDYAGAAAKYAAAFAAIDLEVTPAPMDELARRLRAEEPAVREVLLMALGDWADVVERAQSKAAAAPFRALQQAAATTPWNCGRRPKAVGNLYNEPALNESF